MKVLGIIRVDFDVADELLTKFLHSSDNREKMGVQ
jgi:hypothetical protein